VDDAKPGYKVVVDGQLIARDFATVFPGPQKGTYLAFSRTDRKLDWPAPKGWRSGVVPAAELTETGPGVEIEARVAKGRLALTLQAHRPIVLSPA